ncbi:hypothetical protein M1D68_16165 [Pseudomonas sp. R4-84]
MSNNIPLWPCPFCGCTVQAITGFDYVRIKGDHAGSCVFVDDDPIIADAAEWNTRAALAEVAEVTQGQREPVAVALPPKRETQPFRTIDRGSDNYTAGWNAYANELKRLNPSL